MSRTVGLDVPVHRGASPGVVSVIVPVFNVESFIRECLDSLVAQTYGHFEAILVDDGSTDSSGAICDEYARRDPRFVVMHTKNNGIGAARNLALDSASGTYCFFLDPDDLISPSTLFDLVELISVQQADIAIGVSKNFKGSFAAEYTRVASRTSAEPRVETHIGSAAIVDQIVFRKNDFRPLPEKYDPDPFNFEFFSCLYRMERMNAHSIRFLPLTYGEDTYVLLHYLLVCDSVVSTEMITYWHRRNPASTTFRYHHDYLLETHRYHAFYSELFARLAPNEFARALAGLDGQFFMRCVSAVEREVFFSPRSREIWQIWRTFKEIRTDPRLRGLLHSGAIRYITSRQNRLFMRALYAKQYWILLSVVILRRINSGGIKAMIQKGRDELGSK